MYDLSTFNWNHVFGITSDSTPNHVAFTKNMYPKFDHRLIGSYHTPTLLSRGGMTYLVRDDKLGRYVYHLHAELYS